MAVYEREYRIIRQKIFFLIGLLVLVLWSAIIGSAIQTRADSLAAGGRTTSNLAQAFEENLLRTVATIDQAMRFIRDRYESAPTDFDAAKALQTVDTGFLPALQLSVIDKNGMLMASSMGMPPDRMDLSDREHFQFHRDDPNDHLFVSRPVFGRNSHQWSLQFTRRLRQSDGSFGGVLVLSVDPFVLSAFYNSIDTGRDGLISVVGRDGYLRARSRLSEKMIGTSLKDKPLFEALAKSSTGTYWSTSIWDGVHRILSYRAVADLPLIVVVGLSENEVLGPYHAQLWRGALIGAVSTAILWWFASLLLCRFAANSRRLVSLAGALDDQKTRAQEACAQLAYHQENLEHLVAERTREARMAREAAEQANAAKNRFFAAASHDLRQPIQATRLFIDLLREQMVDSPFAKVIAKLDEAATGSEELLFRLMDVSTLEAGSVSVAREPFALDQLFAALRAEWTVQAQERTLQLRIVDCRAMVDSDAVLLKRMLNNLLANAVRYTSSGGILLGCRRDGHGLRIEVHDTGPGIPADQLEMIFEDFFQIGNLERNRVNGLGLGLGVVRRMAELLDIEVSVRSRVQGGSCFALRLPSVSWPG